MRHKSSIVPTGHSTFFCLEGCMSARIVLCMPNAILGQRHSRGASAAQFCDVHVSGVCAQKGALLSRADPPAVAAICFVLGCSDGGLSTRDPRTWAGSSELSSRSSDDGVSWKWLPGLCRIRKAPTKVKPLLLEPTMELNVDGSVLSQNRRTEIRYHIETESVQVSESGASHLVVHTPCRINRAGKVRQVLHLRNRAEIDWIVADCSLLHADTWHFR